MANEIWTEQDDQDILDIFNSLKAKTKAALQDGVDRINFRTEYLTPEQFAEVMAAKQEQEEQEEQETPAQKAVRTRRAKPAPFATQIAQQDAAHKAAEVRRAQGKAKNGSPNVEKLLAALKSKKARKDGINKTVCRNLLSWNPGRDCRNGEKPGDGVYRFLKGLEKKGLIVERQIEEKRTDGKVFKPHRWFIKE